MGIFDTIFGDQQRTEQRQTRKDTTQQTQKETQERIQKSKQIGTTETEGKTTQQVTGRETLFSEQDLGILGDLTKRLAAGPQNQFGSRADIDTARLSSLAGTLTERAQGGVDIDSIIKSATASARLSFQEGTGADINRFADVVGSTGNSAIQLLRQKGERDLATQIATTEGGLRLRGEELLNQTGALAAETGTRAASASREFDIGETNAINNLLNSLQVARGGTKTSESASVGTSSQLQKDLQEFLGTDIGQSFLESLTNSESEATTITNQEGHDSIFGQLTDFLSLFDKPLGID